MLRRLHWISLLLDPWKWFNGRFWLWIHPGREHLPVWLIQGRHLHFQCFLSPFRLVLNWRLASVNSNVNSIQYKFWLLLSWWVEPYATERHFNLWSGRSSWFTLWSLSGHHWVWPNTYLSNHRGDPHVPYSQTEPILPIIWVQSILDSVLLVWNWGNSRRPLRPHYPPKSMGKCLGW